MLFWIVHCKLFIVNAWSMELGLLQASQNGNMSKVKEILESNQTNINCKDIWFHKSFMKLQLNYMNDLWNRMHFIAFQLRHIWNRNPNVNSTPLIWASENGHTDIVQLLVSQPGIEINSKDMRIQNSFMISIFNYFIIFQVKWLMKLYSNTSIELDSLIAAPCNNHTKIVQFLLSKPGAEINCKAIWIPHYSLHFNSNISSYFNSK